MGVEIRSAMDGNENEVHWEWELRRRSGKILHYVTTVASTCNNACVSVAA